MSAIGDEGGVYQTAGLSHTADGSHEPDLETLEKWHEKLFKKLASLKRRGDLVKIFGHLHSRFSPKLTETGIITWGSSAQAVIAAVEEMEQKK